jgi:hypothetical protein
MSKIEGMPFDLVQLSELPPSKWIGRAVFHPALQAGGVPYWVPAEYPAPYRDEDDTSTLPEFDVGVVLSFERDNWRGEPDNPKAHEVTFVTGSSVHTKSGQRTLHYGAHNLWTPRPAYFDRDFTCCDCGEMAGVDYMVHGVIWEQATKPEERGRLMHLGCLEKRIGRRIVLADFTEAPINHPIRTVISGDPL